MRDEDTFGESTDEWEAMINTSVDHIFSERITGLQEKNDDISEIDNYICKDSHT